MKVGAAIGLAAMLGALVPAERLLAQSPDIISRDLYEERLRQEGNRIVFCYNMAGMMAEFEQDLAREIGQALLAEVRFETVKEGDFMVMPPPYDYRMPLSEDQIFLLMAERCDAFMGFHLSESNPEWLLVSRPYLVAETVMVASDPDYRVVEDIPFGERLGVRMMAPGDTQLINLVGAMPDDRRWRRGAFFNNEMLLDKLLDGSLAAGLIWEPGLYYATDGDPEAHGLYLMDAIPFPVRAVEIGIATRVQDTYLNNLLGDAISALVADGTVTELMERHNLRPSAGG